MKRVVAVDVDLLARARIDEAARAAGLAVESASSRSETGVGADVAMIVVDLDRGREAAFEYVARARERGFTGPAVGFFSHVDESLGAAAEAAGIRALARGRFWRQLPEVLGGGSTP